MTALVSTLKGITQAARHLIEWTAIGLLTNLLFFGAMYLYGAYRVNWRGEAMVWNTPDWYTPLSNLKDKRACMDLLDKRAGE